MYYMMNFTQGPVFHLSSVIIHKRVVISSLLLFMLVSPVGTWVFLLSQGVGLIFHSYALGPGKSCFYLSERLDFKRIHVFHYQMLVQVVSPVGYRFIYQKGQISRKSGYYQLSLDISPVGSWVYYSFTTKGLYFNAFSLFSHISTVRGKTVDAKIIYICFDVICQRRSVFY